MPSYGPPAEYGILGHTNYVFLLEDANSQSLGPGYASVDEWLAEYPLREDETLVVKTPSGKWVEVIKA